jgi:hypothetical protein
MPKHLEVRPEIADRLTALARARGVSVDDLLQEVLDGLELPQDAIAEPSLEELEQDMDALAEGLGELQVRCESSYSREDIYIDHD